MWYLYMRFGNVVATIDITRVPLGPDDQGYPT